MNALALLAAASLAATPIDLALAERTGQRSATLTLLLAEPRLQAICLDLVGYSDEQLEAAKSEAARRPVWLYLGPRKISRGRIASFDSAASPTGPCAVTAQAEFEDPIPIAARSDVLWASSEDVGSSPHLAPLRDAPELARRALPDEASRQACLHPAIATVRAAESGTYVNLVCSDGKTETSWLVRVRKGAPALVLAADPGEEGRLTLIDVLDPGHKSEHALALARETGNGRRVEVWSMAAEGKLQRVDFWAY